MTNDMNLNRIEREHAMLELFKKGSHKVTVGSLTVFGKTGNGIGHFTTGRVTEYNTVYINELDYYEAIWNILSVDDQEVIIYELH